MNDSQREHTPRSGGIGFFGALTLIFITLKLCGIIAWTWVWVLAPLWLPLFVGLLFVLLMLIVGNLAVAVAGRKGKREQNERYEKWIKELEDKHITDHRDE